MFSPLKDFYQIKVNSFLTLSSSAHFIKMLIPYFSNFSSKTYPHLSKIVLTFQNSLIQILKLVLTKAQMDTWVHIAYLFSSACWWNNQCVSPHTH